jgi:hypothetical protein
MKHYNRVSCKIDLETMTKKDIIALSQQRQMELSFKNKTNGYAKATFKDLAKTFDVAIEQLELCCRVTGVQLAYVPHENLIPRNKDDDPLQDYPSLDAKAIALASIIEDDIAFPGQSAAVIALLEENGPFCDTFRISMVRVWNILYEMFGKMPAWLHAAPTKKEKNSCKLYHLLFAHYLGREDVNHLANKMGARLTSLIYREEQMNWDWSQYTDAHIEQHNIAKN